MIRFAAEVFGVPEVQPRASRHNLQCSNFWLHIGRKDVLLHPAIRSRCGRRRGPAAADAPVWPLLRCFFGCTRCQKIAEVDTVPISLGSDSGSRHCRNSEEPNEVHVRHAWSTFVRRKKKNAYIGRCMECLRFNPFKHTPCVAVGVVRWNDYSEVAVRCILAQNVAGPLSMGGAVSPCLRLHRWRCSCNRVYCGSGSFSILK